MKFSPRRWLGEIQRIVIYNGVGVITTLVCLPLMFVSDWLKVPYPVYTVVNYLVGLAVGFPLNYRFAFGDRGAHRGRALVKYWSTYLLLIAAVQGLQMGLIDGAAWPRWVGVGVGLAVYAGGGYLLARFWVFRPARKPAGQGETLSS